MTTSMFQYVSDEEALIPILERVLARWDEVVRPCKRCKAYRIALHVSTQELEKNVLASTLVTKFLYLGEHTFGNTFPMVGGIILNALYLYGSLKEEQLYAVLLHEVGHVLGIGTVWDLPRSPLTLYKEDNRDIHGKQYPGLQDELMTGWIKSMISLSRVTLRFLEDIGYEVDYSKADPPS